MTPAITINFRKAELTAACVRSLIADGWGPILVWDNSADGGVSAASLRPLLAGMENVHLVESQSNLGFAAGMNRALAWLATREPPGPVMLINNDATVVPGLRVALLAATETALAPTLVAPQIAQSGSVQGWKFYQPWFGLVLDTPIWGAVPYLSGCCLLVNRKDNSKPLFDEAFFMYGEDVELSSRIIAQGGRLSLVPVAYVDHVGSAGSGAASEFYERHMVRAHWILASRLSSGAGEEFLRKVLKFPALVLRALIRSLRYRSVEPLKALREVLP
ncbi:MAG TPA: hypothetical protein VF471_04600 [Pseudoxanthomonas sp.]